MKKQYIDNTSTIWGFPPEGEHEAYYGARAIIEHIDGKTYLDYVWNRQSCRGYKSDIERLLKWWTKRNGACKKFLNESVHGTLWTYRDEKTGNFAMAKESYGYVYITLYHN